MVHDRDFGCCLVDEMARIVSRCDVWVGRTFTLVPKMMVFCVDLESPERYPRFEFELFSFSSGYMA